MKLVPLIVKADYYPTEDGQHVVVAVAETPTVWVDPVLSVWVPSTPAGEAAQAAEPDLLTVEFFATDTGIDPSGIGKNYLKGRIVLAADSAYTRVRIAGQDPETLLVRGFTLDLLG